MKHIWTVPLVLVAIGGSLVLGAPAAQASDSTVYVYTDDPSQVAALCAQAQADWGPADHCRVLPARYAGVPVDEAADIADGGW